MSAQRAAIKKVMKDLKEMEKNPQDGAALGLTEDLFELHGNLRIPYGPYAGLLVHMVLKIPQNFPGFDLFFFLLLPPSFSLLFTAHLPPLLPQLPPQQGRLPLHFLLVMGNMDIFMVGRCVMIFSLIMNTIFDLKVLIHLLFPFSLFSLFSFSLSPPSHPFPPLSGEVSSGWSKDVSLSGLMMLLKAFLANIDTQTPSEKTVKGVFEKVAKYECPGCDHKGWKPYPSLPPSSSPSPSSSSSSSSSSPSEGRANAWKVEKQKEGEERKDEGERKEEGMKRRKREERGRRLLACEGGKGNYVDDRELVMGYPISARYLLLLLLLLLLFLFLFFKTFFKPTKKKLFFSPRPSRGNFSRQKELILIPELLSYDHYILQCQQGGLYEIGESFPRGSMRTGGGERGGKGRDYTHWLPVFVNEEHFEKGREMVENGVVELYNFVKVLFCFILFFILFYFILFYLKLFYFILFYFILFYFILFYFILFYFKLF